MLENEMKEIEEGAYYMWLKDIIQQLILAGNNFNDEKKKIENLNTCIEQIFENVLPIEVVRYLSKVDYKKNIKNLEEFFDLIDDKINKLITINQEKIFNGVSGTEQLISQMEFTGIINKVNGELFGKFFKYNKLTKIVFEDNLNTVNYN